MSRFPFEYWFLLLGLSPLLGCDWGPRIVPVSGQVVIDGKPLQNGFVRFIPDNARAASSEIDGNGRFTLTTVDANDGCVVGKHKVEIISKEFPSQTQTLWLIPRKYSDLATSGLEIMIERPQTDLKIELRWDGGQPEVENTDSQGDIPP